jgi:hypothetical protein
MIEKQYWIFKDYETKSEITRRRSLREIPGITHRVVIKFNNIEQLLQ